MQKPYGEVTDIARCCVWTGGAYGFPLPARQRSGGAAVVDT